MTDPHGAPTRDAEPRLASLARRLWRDHARGEWRALLLVFSLMAVVSGATGLYPLVIDWAYRLFEARDARVVWLVPLVAVAIVVVKAAAQYAQTVAMQGVVLRVVLSLQAAMFDRLLVADLARLQAEPAARLASRFTNDMGVVRESVGRAVSGVVDALTLAALVAAMLWLDWVMTLAAALIIPLAAIPIERIGRRMRKASKAQQEQAGEVTAVLSESLAGARLVKAYGLEAMERRRAGEAFRSWYARLMKVVRNRARVDPLLEAMGGVAVAAVIAFAGWRIASGAASAGQFTGFVAALLIAARPLRALGTLAVALQEGAAALARAFALIDERPRVIDHPHARPLAPGPGQVAFRGVSFSYGNDRAALDGIDLVIEPGTTVALVGP
ncbi:MAG: ABC transporter transmembrane domain-containing protein, partial [Elioraea sp.]|nr:ABC transporter transmembrane domain-containing protein [Elioraea sp.]